MKAKYLLFIFVVTAYAVTTMLICASCENPWMREILEPKTITYESNGGSHVPSKTVIKGVKVPMQRPSRIGYEFVTWYIDNGTFEEPWDFDVVPTADITLYAKWELDTGTPGLSFTLIDGGTAYSVSGGSVNSGAVRIPVYYSPNANSPALPVTAIADQAFENCWQITSVTIPEGVTSIGYEAFCVCESLTSIKIPASVTSIGYGAFYGSGITSVTFAANSRITAIDDTTFYSANHLKSITIPASVKSIGKSAFAASGLTSVTIPAGVTSIGEGAFSECYSLPSITIPASVTSIGNSVFRLSSNLTSITVAANNPNYASEGGILYNKAKTNLLAYPSAKGSITIRAGVTSIGYGALEGCEGLTGITIPNSVTSIGDFAFASYGLTSVTIPASVTSLGRGAFYTSLSILQSVTFAGTIASGSFDNGTGFNSVFPGNLRAKFYETNATNGTPGTYTVTSGAGSAAVWTRQP